MRKGPGWGHQDAFLRPRLSAAVGSVRGPSSGRGATGEMRRFRTFAHRHGPTGMRPEAAVVVRVSIRFVAGRSRSLQRWGRCGRSSTPGNSHGDWTVRLRSLQLTRCETSRLPEGPEGAIIPRQPTRNRGNGFESIGLDAMPVEIPETQSAKRDGSGRIERKCPTEEFTKMVLTAHDKLGNSGRKTGFWLEAQLYGDNHPRLPPCLSRRGPARNLRS
jgi:hypothetical protein